MVSLSFVESWKSNFRRLERFPEGASRTLAFVFNFEARVSTFIVRPVDVATKEEFLKCYITKNIVSIVFTDRDR